MHLSTSNSEIPASIRGGVGSGITAANVRQLLAVIALTCIAIEAGIWWYEHKISSYVRHFQAEYSQAVSLKHGGDAKSVLVVGNSTVRQDVNIDSLRSRLSPNYECYVLAIESTTYLDWYFGLKEMFRKGSQPDYIVLVLPANNVLEVFPVPDFSPYYLVGTHDIVALARAQHLNATAASNVAVEHFSAFFTSRNALRASVKKHLFPGFESMASKYMKQSGASRPLALADNRMRDLKALCEPNGTTLFFVIPPTNRPDDSQDSRVLQLAREARLAAAMPVPDSALTASYYSDGFHLNEVGRDLFTANLAAYLRGQFLAQPEGTATMQTAKN